MELSLESCHLQAGDSTAYEGYGPGMQMIDKSLWAVPVPRFSSQEKGARFTSKFLVLYFGKMHNMKNKFWVSFTAATI